MKRKVIWARLRVECNFGSKYFSDESKARAYYDGKVAERKDAELWLEMYLVPRKGQPSVVQELIDSYSTFEPTWFD